MGFVKLWLGKDDRLDLETDFKRSRAQNACKDGPQSYFFYEYGREAEISISSRYRAGNQRKPQDCGKPKALAFHEILMYLTSMIQKFHPSMVSQRVPSMVPERAPCIAPECSPSMFQNVFHPC